MRTYDIEVTRRPLVDDPRPRPRQATNFSAQLRMLQSWPEWIRTTTASIAGSCGITATTRIGVSAGTLWWPPSTTLASFLRTSPRGRRSCAVAGSAVKTYIRPNRYPGRCMSRDIGACSETLTYSSELSSTGSCLHALRSWSCRLTPRPYERSVVLMAPG